MNDSYEKGRAEGGVRSVLPGGLMFGLITQKVITRFWDRPKKVGRKFEVIIRL